MARPLKPQIVDEVKSPNGLVRCPVFFDRNEKDFYVELTGPDDRVRRDSIIEVKKAAQEMLSHAVAYKWAGVIAVELEDAYDEKHKLGSIHSSGKWGTAIKFEFDRYERSPHPSRPGHFVYREHTIDFEAGEPGDQDRKEREKNLSRQPYVGAHAVVLPYTVGAWASLLALKKAVDEAHAQLTGLLERRDLVALLDRGLPRLLGGKGE